jgi:uncharacterized membrane protein YhaH (DUF805 family)
MSFQDAVIVCLRKYVDFNGRARRSEYWWFVAFTAVVTTVASVADARVDTPFGSTGLVQGLATLALLLPSLAVSVRRLHDVGQSGWSLLLIILPVLGALILIFVFLQPRQRARQQVRALTQGGERRAASLTKLGHSILN